MRIANSSVQILNFPQICEKAKPYFVKAAVITSICLTVFASYFIAIQASPLIVPGIVAIAFLVTSGAMIRKSNYTAFKTAMVTQEILSGGYIIYLSTVIGAGLTIGIKELLLKQEYVRAALFFSIVLANIGWVVPFIQRKINNLSQFIANLHYDNKLRNVHYLLHSLYKGTTLSARNLWGLFGEPRRILSGAELNLLSINFSLENFFIFYTYIFERMGERGINPSVIELQKIRFLITFFVEELNFQDKNKIYNYFIENQKDLQMDLTPQIYADLFNVGSLNTKFLEKLEQFRHSWQKNRQEMHQWMNQIKNTPDAEKACVISEKKSIFMRSLIESCFLLNIAKLLVTPVRSKTDFVSGISTSSTIISAKNIDNYLNEIKETLTLFLEFTSQNNQAILTKFRGEVEALEKEVTRHLQILRLGIFPSDFNQTITSTREQFNALRTQLTKAFRMSLANTQLLEDNPSAMRNDQDYHAAITEMHEKMIQPGQSLVDSFQQMNSLHNQLLEEEEEPFSPAMWLAETCFFKQIDYQVIQKNLDLKEITDIDPYFLAVGLDSTETIHAICATVNNKQREWQAKIDAISDKTLEGIKAIGKNQHHLTDYECAKICDEWEKNEEEGKKRFLELIVKGEKRFALCEFALQNQAKYKSIAKIVPVSVSTTPCLQFKGGVISLRIKNSHHRLDLFKLEKKVAELFYRLVTAGMILVPAIIFPVPAAVGFACGTAYYSLIRFHNYFVPESKFFLRKERENVESFLNFGHCYRLINLRSFDRNQINQYGKASIWQRMRMISYQLFTGILMTSSPFFGLTTGIAFSRDLIMVDNVLD